MSDHKAIREALEAGDMTTHAFTTHLGDRQVRVRYSVTKAVPATLEDPGNDLMVEAEEFDAGHGWEPVSNLYPEAVSRLHELAGEHYTASA